MKLLIISFYYAPHVAPRAFRWTTLAEYWARQGHRLDVVCGWALDAPRHEWSRGVAVHRVGGAISEWVRSRLRKAKETQKLAVLEDPGSMSKARHGLHVAGGTAVKWLHDHTWKKVYWPDCYCLWYYPARRMCRRLLRERSYDAVISVSAPFTPHVVARSLQGCFPQAPWIMDVGDPFCFLEREQANHGALYRNLNQAYEGAAFRRAQAIAVTTQATADRYRALFPESAAKIEVVPPLLSIQEAPPSPKTLPRDNRLRLVYVGTLYAALRNPTFFLSLLREVFATPLGKRVEMHFYGNVYDAFGCFEPFQDLVGKQIFLHGWVRREQAVQAMQDADVLVNLGNDTLYQLPSKVVEYASTGKPVFNLVTSEGDSSMDFFRTYPAAFCLLQDTAVPQPRHVAQLAQFLAELPTPMDGESLQQWLEPYRIEAIARAYQRLIGDRPSPSRPRKYAWEGATP